MQSDRSHAQTIPVPDFRICIVGADSSGRTSLLEKLCGPCDRFKSNDGSERITIHDYIPYEKIYEISVLDNEAREEGNGWRDQIKKADAIIFTYDLSLPDPDPGSQVRNYATSNFFRTRILMKAALEYVDNEQAIIMLAGTKSDIQDDLFKRRSTAYSEMESLWKTTCKGEQYNGHLLHCLEVKINDGGGSVIKLRDMLKSTLCFSQFMKKSFIPQKEITLTEVTPKMKSLSQPPQSSLIATTTNSMFGKMNSSSKNPEENLAPKPVNTQQENKPKISLPLPPLPMPRKEGPMFQPAGQLPPPPIPVFQEQNITLTPTSNTRKSSY